MSTVISEEQFNDLLVGLRRVSDSGQINLDGTETAYMNNAGEISLHIVLPSKQVLEMYDERHELYAVFTTA